MPPVTIQNHHPIRRGAVQRTARVLTELFAPAVLAAAMPIIIALHATASLAVGVGWGLLAAFFSSAVPYGMIWLGVRRGQLTDHHIGQREQRRKPLILGLISVLIGLAVLLIAGAPRELVAIAGAIVGVALAAPTFALLGVAG